MHPARQYLNIVHQHTPANAVIGLTSIHNGNVKTQWFLPSQITQLIETVALIGKKENVYIRLTPLAAAPRKGRGNEQQSLGSSVLWADYDSYQSQVDGLQRLHRFQHPPTMIVNSGNGLHAYWLLDRFYDDLEAIKARNKAIITQLNQDNSDDLADSCYDLARILRLPGTYNIKRLQPLECSIVDYHPDRVYKLTDFTPAPLQQETAIVVWDSEPLPSDFLERVKERNSKLYKRLYSEETALKADAPTAADGTIDRSRNDAYIALALLGLGYEVATVLSVLMQPDLLAGSKFCETSRYDYVVTTVNKAFQVYSSSEDRYFVKTTFQADKLAGELQEQFKFIFTSEKLWRYNQGVFHSDGENYIKAEVVKRLGRRWTSKASDETIRWITDQARIDHELVNRHDGLVNVQNGMVHALSGEVLPHSPNYLSLCQLPAIYDPDVDCASVDQFVGAILPEDTIPVFWEYVGSAFLTTVYWPKAFIALVGPGNTGKSKLLEWLFNFFGGRNNTTALSLQMLADNKFASGKLFGKIANIFSDLDEGEAQNTGQIKALTGDDVISGEQKFKDFFMFKNTARLFFSANHYPRVKNPDKQFFDRAMIFKCTNKFTRETADKDIVSKMSTPQHFSAALKRAIEGLKRVLEQNGFSNSLSLVESSNDYRFSADTVSGFLHACEFNPDYAITKQLFYQHYKQMCLSASRKPVSDDMFFKRISDNLELFGMTQEYRMIKGTDQRQWCYIGRKPSNVMDIFVKIEAN